MTTPQEKLASSLEVLRRLQAESAAVIRSNDFTRTHRERLLANGFLEEVIRGWYIVANPNDRLGDTTAWYASYWDFVTRYLTDRFGNDWCLSPEASLSIHAGNWVVPGQLLVRAPHGSNKPIQLPHNTSIYDMRVALPAEEDVQIENGLRIYAVPTALIAAAPITFERDVTNLQVILAGQRDASALLARLLEGGHSVIAGRLAGAYRNIGRDRIADTILKTMTSAGYIVNESDPFQEQLAIELPKRALSPAASRIRLLWHKLREGVLGIFPAPPGIPSDIKRYLEQVDDAYVTDAYHSLSIEGYRVSEALIERVRGGSWNPDNIEEDREHRDALAARGYWQAFEEVKKSVLAVLQHEAPGSVADDDHGNWYRELFRPSVLAGIVKPADLAGYRNNRVYIRGSRYTPLAPNAVLDAMTVFFELLAEEKAPAVRVVLGHFIFVYIHPYMDGNGRMGRFLMNLMLASGGYPWTVIPVERRSDYMAALEEASVRENIEPFARFLSELVESNLQGAPLPTPTTKR